MQEPIKASRSEFCMQDGCRISYYADTSNTGRPLCLVHSINAAPSAHEMKPLFDHYRVHRPVYALDLPGFGFSDRSKRRYSPMFYASVINSFVNDVIQESCDLVTFSLSSEFAAIFAVENAKLIHSLAMISPTGLSQRTPPTGAITEYIRLIISAPPVGNLLFSLLTSRKSIRFFLNRNYVGDVPEEMVEYAYATSHQPNAKHAPYYFLSGQLFTSNVCEKYYCKLSGPVLVIYDKDPNVSFDLLPEVLSQCKHWQATRIAPTLGIPQWEKPKETFEALEQFWDH